MTLSRQSDSRDEGRTSSSISPASGISTPDLDNTITRMDEHIQTFASEGDPRERFLLMYRTFKGELRKSIQQGRFMDEAWSEAACVRMAETYFEAVQQYDAGDPACPECWVRSFDRSLEGETNFLQDALLGMNAHINYDLIIATYDTLRTFGSMSTL